MNVPVKLYKYRRMSVKSIQSIACNIVYFAEPSSLNDPFDCRIHPTSYTDGTEDEFRELFTRLAKRNPQIENVAEEVERMISERLHLDTDKLEKAWVDTQNGENKKVGLFCLSADPTHILMWSHYADDHKGFCLEFSTVNSIFKMARNVEYPPSYPNHRFIDCMNDRELLHKLTLFTKANLWEYEQEWRVLGNFGMVENGKGFYRFAKEALTGIIFGWSMPTEDKVVLGKLVEGRNPSVQLYQAHRRKREFKMQIVPIS